jgi:hypothetical protein
MKTGVLHYGDIVAQEVSKRIAGTFATTTTLKTLGPKARMTGMLASVEADNSVWMYDADSTASAGATVLVPDDAPAAGRWVTMVFTPTPSDTDPLVDAAAAAAGSNAQYSRRDHVHPDSMGAGTCTLVAGTVTVTDAQVVATSRVVVTRNIANTCTNTTGGYQVTKTTGSFTVIACVAAGTINNADISTLDYVVKY